MKNLLFQFEDLSAKDKIVKEVGRQFRKAGADVAQVEVPNQLKRSSGVTYKEIVITFADSQSVILRVKQTGDIFQALVNKKVLPIKNQDEHEKAFLEIVKVLEAGRAKFQRALANIKAKLPPSIKTAAPKMLEVLTQKRDDLKSAIAAAKETSAKLEAKLEEITGGIDPADQP